MPEPQAVPAGVISELSAQVEIKETPEGRIGVYYHRAGASMRFLEVPKALFVEALDRFTRAGTG